jgi:hypothetical protein
MKLAIMQPYFLPYIGYFQLINAVDEFILFDTPQFIRHGWIERNRILNQKGEPIYVKVPLKKHNRGTPIKDIIVNNSENWKEKILAQLVTYKKKAPHYWKVIALIKTIFEFESDSIVEINHNALLKVCEYLKIDTPISIWSKMDIEIDPVNAPDEWALNICKALNADIYYNPVGGASFFDKNKYERAGIEIKFLEMIPNPYKQFSNHFVPFLSIIDVMMFCEPGEINNSLNTFNFIA